MAEDKKLEQANGIRMTFFETSRGSCGSVSIELVRNSAFCAVTNRYCDPPDSDEIVENSRYVSKEDYLEGLQKLVSEGACNMPYENEKRKDRQYTLNFLLKDDIIYIDGIKTKFTLDDLLGKNEHYVE